MECEESDKFLRDVTREINNRPTAAVDHLSRSNPERGEEHPNTLPERMGMFSELDSDSSDPEKYYITLYPCQTCDATGKVPGTLWWTTNLCPTCDGATECTSSELPIDSDSSELESTA